MTTPREEELQAELDILREERNQYHAQLADIKIEGLMQARDDHERRLRPIEEAVTKFNFILFLSMGGGLVSLINLAALMFLIAQNKP